MDNRSGVINAQPVRRKKKGEMPECFDNDPIFYADFIRWKTEIKGQKFRPGDPVERFGQEFTEFLQHRVDECSRAEAEQKADKEAAEIDKTSEERSGINENFKSGNKIQINQKNVMRMHDAGFDPNNDELEFENPIHAAYANDSGSGDWSTVGEVMARIEAKKINNDKKVQNRRV